MPIPNTAAEAASADLTPGRLVARYWLDALWRAIAAADTLRERAANMSAHEAAGMPPLLHFESEPVGEGRDLEPPSNYRLLRVTRCGTDALEKHVRKGAAPVILVKAAERAYAQWVSPWVRLAATPETARVLRELHPMRVSRQIWSEKATPALAWLPWMRRWLDQWGAQGPDRSTNPWYQLERVGADACAQAWESWRTSRDLWAEVAFQQIYAR